jgi:hypothetical protein
VALPLRLGERIGGRQFDRCKDFGFGHGYPIEESRSFDALTTAAEGQLTIAAKRIDRLPGLFPSCDQGSPDSDSLGIMPGHEGVLPHQGQLTDYPTTEGVTSPDAYNGCILATRCAQLLYQAWRLRVHTCGPFPGPAQSPGRACWFGCRSYRVVFSYMNKHHIFHRDLIRKVGQGDSVPAAPAEGSGLIRDHFVEKKGQTHIGMANGYSFLRYNCPLPRN